MGNNDLSPMGRIRPEGIHPEGLPAPQIRMNVRPCVCIHTDMGEHTQMTFSERLKNN
jgi:hypothetical protein